MTLQNLEIGQTAVVRTISLAHDVSRRLEMLGLTGGTEIRLLNKKKSGAVIVKLRGTRYAFGRDIANGIEVANA